MYTQIKFPYDSNYLQPTSKQKNTILIDHYWEDFLGTNNDWTYRIQEWLECLNDYSISRLLRFNNEEQTLRDFEKPLKLMNYRGYLKETEKIENFIITHRESLTDDLFRFYKNFYFEDAIKAFSLGVRSPIKGDFIHLNVPTYMKWLRQHIDLIWDARSQVDKGADPKQVLHYRPEPKQLTTNI